MEELSNALREKEAEIEGMRKLLGGRQGDGHWGATSNSSKRIG